MTTKPHPGWDLKIFRIVSPKVSDFFEGNSTTKTLTKFDDHQTLPCLGLRNFSDGLTESVRLFWGKFYFQHFNKFRLPPNLALSGTSKFFRWSNRKCQTFLREILGKLRETSSGYHQTWLCMGLRNFLDGLTESVRLFWGKFYFQHFNKFRLPPNLALTGT